MHSLLSPFRMGILLLLISFGTISAVLLTPALPELAREFGISKTSAQLTMSIFLVGYTIGQLPYGPIANRLGRKKAVYVGIALMLAGSLLAIGAHSFWVLVLGRFIQALGAAVGLKITFTMISDCHSGQEATRAISLLSLAFALMPAIGVTIGGFIIDNAGWRGCFVFLSLYAVFLGLLVLCLPETGKELDKNALEIKKIAHGYAKQFKNSSTVLNALLMGFITSSFYIFATLSPYIGIDRIGLSPKQFGLWNLLLCLGLFGGVIFTRWYAKKDKPQLAILLGICIMIPPILAMFILFSFSWVTVWTLFIPASLIRIGSNTIWSNASSRGMSASTDKSNTSAVMQFLNLSVATLGLFFIGTIPTTHIMLLPLTFLILTILLLAVWKKSS